MAFVAEHHPLALLNNARHRNAIIGCISYNSEDTRDNCNKAKVACRLDRSRPRRLWGSQPNYVSMARLLKRVFNAQPPRSDLSFAFHTTSVDWCMSDCTLLRISKFFSSFSEMLDISASDLWVAQLCVGRHCSVPEDLDVVICSQDAPRVSDAVAIVRHSDTKSISYY